MAEKHSAENDALTMEQIEAMVEEVIEANTVWPDPLPSQVSAVMDIMHEAMAQARAESLAVAAALLGRVVEYWDGRPTEHHGHHIEADLRDVLRAIEADRDHNAGPPHSAR